MIITGGVGARHGGESFGAAYELPNDSAYAETCAAIGLALWSHRLNLMHADAQYADVLERALYNGVLSGIALDGTLRPLSPSREAALLLESSPDLGQLRLRLAPLRPVTTTVGSDRLKVFLQM